VGKVKHRQHPAQDLARLAAGHYGQRLQRYFMGFLRNADKARDLEQEVYLRLLRVKDADLVHDPKGYVFRIAAHVIYEFRDRERRERVSFDSSAVDAWARELENAAPEEQGERLSSQRELQQLLCRLQPMTRAIFLLRKRDGLSQEEVAERLGISVFTVKKHMLRAVATLRLAARDWDASHNTGV
jgi:RNA polymerase sigma factor (sigma-70 family)